MPNSRHDLFNYTSGSWLVNKELRLAERKHEFDDIELRRLAAESVGRTLKDVDSMEKLDEGGFNRVFRVTMHDGFQMIARVPYPLTQPKFYVVASEVATMGFLRAHGVPIPKVYGYSPTSDNAAKTEYIFMEFVKGNKLADLWPHLKDVEMAAVLRALVELESRIMSIPFPAGGSLYYADDLKRVAGDKKGIPISLKGQQFCIGPDVRVDMWHGRRLQLDVSRGPYETVEEALVAPAHKEIAYLERFGQPLLPFQRWRREAYNFDKQSPLDHIENIKRYVRMAPLLIPKNPSHQAFCLRHPDLHPSNVMVYLSPDSDHMEITSVIDWQHATILPLFLVANIPQRFQNYDDPVSQSLILPSFPPNADKMDEDELRQAVAIHDARLTHYYYAKATAELNSCHHESLWDWRSIVIRRLWHHAGRPWNAEIHDLKALLIEATEDWEALVGPGLPCPVEFEPEDVSKTKAFSERLQVPDEIFQDVQNGLGFGSQTWISNDDYEKAKELAELLKARLLGAIAEEELRNNVQANWLLDDMDEKDYM
ncbi:hypothetical protein CVT24_008723 [Panaeolus cyanescens]|uniref:Aminoglycoside phosphotransferase domain-containing protein n=1 Tax=Panaeolus cyanescens TaxID=181874 RepID=A0A409VB16_9AGAR|nr:hypothetical protein CVT24_008723 [Panaeolus cyanescens]